MNNTILNGGEVVYFAIKMNGNVLGEKFTDRSMAETTKTRMLNENANTGMTVPVTIDVVQVTANGQEVLFG